MACWLLDRMAAVFGLMRFCSRRGAHGGLEPRLPLIIVGSARSIKPINIGGHGLGAQSMATDRRKIDRALIAVALRPDIAPPNRRVTR